MSEKDFHNAVNNRCSISDESKCVDCKAIKESCKYVAELEAENKHLKKLTEYGRHKEDCNLKPWENTCKCGYIKALKGGAG